MAEPIAAQQQADLVIEALKARFSGADLVLGTGLAERHASLWDTAPTSAKALVFARSTEDVSFVLKTCHAAGQPVITQGGLTGLVRGAEARRGDVILSLEKMTAIGPPDPAGGTVVVEAGAILEVVQDEMKQHGLRFPLDLGARGSCTIGGNVATNAGGINVIRYGMMRNLVLGLEAVLADGTVLSSMNQMLKNNAGYDLKQLFIGTEGTLGVVTRIVLRLFPEPKSSNSALVAMHSFDAVSAFLARARAGLGGNLSAFEVMWGGYFAAVTGDDGHRAPMARDHGFYAIILSEGVSPDADQAAFEALLNEALEEGEIIDAVLPKSEAESRAIWTIREDFSPLLTMGPVFVYDVSLPIRDMAAYVARIEAQITQRWEGGRLFTFGHIADGNLHLFVLPGTDQASHDDSDQIVYGVLADYPGSVSAEHGIGIEKKGWLSSSRTAEEIAIMKALKATLDPKTILNPAVMFG